MTRQGHMDSAFVQKLKHRHKLTPIVYQITPIVFIPLLIFHLSSIVENKIPAVNLILAKVLNTDLVHGLKHMQRSQQP